MLCLRKTEFTIFLQVFDIKLFFSLGDCVYVKSDQDKPTLYRIDKMWIDRYGQRYFHGPLFIRPNDIEHPPTRLFYKNEMFICGVEDTRTMDSIIGRCVVLWVRDYCSSKLFIQFGLSHCLYSTKLMFLLFKYYPILKMKIE